MKRNIGLWIDHRQAIIVRVFDTGETKTHIDSNLPGRVRYSGASFGRSATNPHDGTTEDRRERRYESLRNRYFDKVIAQLTDSDAIFIMGPGEAKTALQRRLAQVSQTPVVVEAADKMTENQIVATIRQHFQTV